MDLYYLRLEGLEPPTPSFVAMYSNPTELQAQFGVIGFEPTTYWSQTSRATKLRYTPRYMHIIPIDKIIEIIS